MKSKISEGYMTKIEAVQGQTVIIICEKVSDFNTEKNIENVYFMFSLFRFWWNDSQKIRKKSRVGTN